MSVALENRASAWKLLPRTYLHVRDAVPLPPILTETFGEKGEIPADRLLADGEELSVGA